MVFSDLIFLFFFLPAVILVTKLSPKAWRNLELLLFSLLFYAWGEPVYVFLMLAVIGVNYFAGLLVSRFPRETRPTQRKLALTLSVAVNLAILGTFKYAGFFAESLNSLTGSQLTVPQIVLPIGISFYIFQSMSYVIDVYREQVEPQRSPLTFGTYVALFPQLIAGPIVRYRDIADQLRDREETRAHFAQGVVRFVYGLAKKVLLANQMGLLADRMLLTESGSFSAWMGMAAYTLQIYFDFSGYSDMAIGLGRMLGFRFKENFAHPYVSRSITEFWKRWHISLSSWLQEYLYIPLGGNRRGQARTYLNLLLTMLIGGLWHGANWTFVAWGGLHGLALCLHKLYARWRRKHGLERRRPLWTGLSVLLTFSFVSFCFIFFRAESIGAALGIVAGIFTLRPGLHFVSFWAVTALVLTGLCSLAAIVRSRKNGTAVEGFYPLVDLGSFRGLTLFFLFVGLTLALGYTGQSPFIYFQF